MDEQTVLIVSDDIDFSRAVTGRWQSERCLPTFTLMGSDLCSTSTPVDGAFDAAVIGDVKKNGINKALRFLKSAGVPALWVRDEANSPRIDQEIPAGVVMMRRREGWTDTVVSMMTEILRRCASEAKQQSLLQQTHALEHDAALGRYMLEMRHTLNNALTSVLGNSELLLLETRVLSSQALPQVETIHNMSMRIHEILQRFSSLEKELNLSGSTQAVRSAAVGRSH